MNVRRRRSLLPEGKAQSMRTRGIFRPPAASMSASGSGGGQVLVTRDPKIPKRPVERSETNKVLSRQTRARAHHSENAPRVLQIVDIVQVNIVHSEAPICPNCAPSPVLFPGCRNYMSACQVRASKAEEAEEE